ncbi:hypothetical protein [Candidatus Magnetomonas plexicatena]|uniref:hypothetical protein n=1 Tax=Candidatus Magnetomonas plexicatena TaxID=2552947 RepID=UPI001C7573E0|nr:hypothetical protein E2O03_011695 [Nitrospirales bacterium LBB_01]
MKIRNKIIAVVITVSVPLILISSFIINRELLHEALKEREEDLIAISKIQASRINLMYDRYMDNMIMLKNRTTTKKRLALYLETKDYDLIAKIGETLHEVKETNSIFHKISVFDLSGKVVASTDKTEIDSNDASFVKDLKDCSLIDIFQGKDGEPDFHFSCPLTLNGKTLGIVSAVIDGHYVLEITSDYTALGNYSGSQI